MTTIGWVKHPTTGEQGKSWNPITGCSKISPGCQHCYAERLSHRFSHTSLPWIGPNAATNVVTHYDRLLMPLRVRRPTIWFVNSMSDLFHEQVPTGFIDRVFGIMALCADRGHIFQILTKRAGRMRDYLTLPGRELLVWTAAFNAAIDAGLSEDQVKHWNANKPTWPLPNVWCGVSTEDQRRANERIPHLLAMPAAIRFISAEPLLEAIDLEPWLRHGLDWVIAGGESGGPPERRMVVRQDGQWQPTEWAQAAALQLRDQCADAQVPFFWKQWGGPTPTAGGNLLDGVVIEQLPTLEKAR